MKADDYKHKVNITIQCNTGPTILFPNYSNCTNKATMYVFGDPYCKECALEIIDAHVKSMHSK